MKASRAWAQTEKRIGPMIKPWDITKIRDQTGYYKNKRSESRDRTKKESRKKKWYCKSKVKMFQGGRSYQLC